MVRKARNLPLVTGQMPRKAVCLYQRFKGVVPERGGFCQKAAEFLFSERVPFLKLPQSSAEGPVFRLFLVRTAASQLTTLTGFPPINAARLFTAMSISRWRLSLGAHAIWGVMMQFLAFSKGFVPCIGSRETTSTAAA